MHLILLSTIAGIALAVEPISMAFAVVFGAGALAWDRTFCRVTECCDNYSILANVTVLQQNLEKKVFGQPLVQNTVVNAIKAHFKEETPSQKALVMSLHGPVGTGKNLVTSFIVEAVYKSGAGSKFFHYMNGGRHFSNKDRVAEYKDFLHTKIEEALKACERSIFVFDDVHLIPPKVLDAVSPYIDFHKQVNGVDPRKAIFIFISNIGSTIITKQTVEIWRQGKKREDIQLADFEGLLRKGAYNEEGGLHGSESIKSHLIDFFIPFLPLEEKHVKMCVRDEFAKLGEFYDENTMQSILQDMVFIPDEKLFSSSGCKRVASRVKVAVQKHKYNLF